MSIAVLSGQCISQTTGIGSIVVSQYSDSTALCNIAYNTMIVEFRTSVSINFAVSNYSLSSSFRLVCLHCSLPFPLSPYL